MKATKATIQRRIEEVLRIRLDGAEFWDVREYAREKEQEAGTVWELKDGAKPLSDGQLWRYIGRADRLIAESSRASRKRLIRRHLAQRRNLYAKSVVAGDYRTALAILRDEAELQGLYPEKAVKLKGDKENPVRLIDELVVIDASSRTTPPDEGSPGPETIPAR
jgi:hypothetical protein